MTHTTQHKFAHVKIKIITLSEKCVRVMRLCRVSCGEDWAEWRGTEATESWITLGERAGATVRPSGGLNICSHTRFCSYSTPPPVSWWEESLLLSFNLKSGFVFTLAYQPV